MATVLREIPVWLPAYWVGVTVVRLVISAFAIFVHDRPAPSKRSAERSVGAWATSAVLAVWVLLAIYLGNINFFRIDEDTLFPSPSWWSASRPGSDIAPRRARAFPPP